MNSATVRPSFQCTQCGARLEVLEGETFFTCPSCSSALYLDRSQVVFHYALASTLNVETAERTLRRWMGGNETVKDLDRKAEIERPTLRHFPYGTSGSRKALRRRYTSSQGRQRYSAR